MIMKHLLAFNNSLDANMLIVTTHSPYLINGLTIAIKAGLLLKDHSLSDEIREKIDSVFPIKSAIQPDEIAIYEFNEVEGTVEILDTYNGLPSDDNFLNNMLERTNEDFANLLEIQQEL
jgi:hypothetical protein